MTRVEVYKEIDHYLRNGKPRTIVSFAKALTLALEIMKSDARKGHIKPKAPKVES